MDDNKVLTLVSQERIPLTPEMRLLLEVSGLRNATPATVSRGGVLYINEADIGWRPFVDTWLSRFKTKGDEHANNKSISAVEIERFKFINNILVFM
jgi:dynein heavy chain